MGKGHHWELWLWRLYLVPGPSLSLCFLAIIKDIKLFYPDLHGMRLPPLSLWPKPQLWNQAAEQWLEEPKNNSLCKTQRGLWLLKRSRKCSRNRVSVSSIHLPKVKRAAPHHSENGFALETAFLGIQGARGTWPSWLFCIIDNFLCVAAELDILQTLYSPCTHLWFEYGKYPQVHMLSAWSPAAVLFWEEVVMLGGRA